MIFVQKAWKIGKKHVASPLIETLYQKQQELLRQLDEQSIRNESEQIQIPPVALKEPEVPLFTVDPLKVFVFPFVIYLIDSY